MNTFDWKQFHKDFDSALAAYLVEKGGSIHDELITFAEFSNGKVLHPEADIKVIDLVTTDPDDNKSVQ